MHGVVLGDEVVQLRPLNLDDVDEWMAGEDDEQIRWFEFPGPAGRADVVGAIRNWMRSWRENGPVRQWAVCDTTSGRILGGVEVREMGNGEVNLSYVVFPAARRRGVAARAAAHAIAYASREMGAGAVVLKILEGNDASLGVARRLGAVESGTEPSERGGTFLILRRDLAANELLR